MEQTDSNNWRNRCDEYWQRCVCTIACFSDIHEVYGLKSADDSVEVFPHKSVVYVSLLFNEMYCLIFPCCPLLVSGSCWVCQRMWSCKTSLLSLLPKYTNLLISYCLVWDFEVITRNCCNITTNNLQIQAFLATIFDFSVCLDECFKIQIIIFLQSNENGILIAFLPNPPLTKIVVWKWNKLCLGVFYIKQTQYKCSKSRYLSLFCSHKIESKQLTWHKELFIIPQIALLVTCTENTQVGWVLESLKYPCLVVSVTLGQHCYITLNIKSTKYKISISWFMTS